MLEGVITFKRCDSHRNHTFPYYCMKSYFHQGHQVSRHQKLLKYIFLVKKCYYIMFLAISPKNNDLNGAKPSQNNFHFQSTAIFFKIDQFTKLLHISVSLSYDAS